MTDTLDTAITDKIKDLVLSQPTNCRTHGAPMTFEGKSSIATQLTQRLCTHLKRHTDTDIGGSITSEFESLGVTIERDRVNADTFRGVLTYAPAEMDGTGATGGTRKLGSRKETIYSDYFDCSGNRVEERTDTGNEVLSSTYPRDQPFLVRLKIYAACGIW
jgi:hypothetical protein